MVDGALTSEAVLVATEDVLRRYGPAKATVVDVARALGVSHGSVYRHFATKAALREAVTRRWLDRAHAELGVLAADTEIAPPERLRRWLGTLFEAKRRKALDDPELFATYSVLASEHSSLVDAHLADLVGQISGIIAEGVATGDFVTKEPVTAARAVFDATTRFHDPAHAAEWSAPGVREQLSVLCDLLLAGLRAGA